jgi:hypothetical protein
MTIPTDRPMTDDHPRRPDPPDQMTRFLGGRPLAVLLRLVLLSIVIGVILHAVGLDPADIIRSIRNLVRAVWDMGFDAVLWLWRYFLLGAVVVVPIWFIMRLLRASGGR